MSDKLGDALKTIADYRDAKASPDELRSMRFVAVLASAVQEYREMVERAKMSFSIESMHGVLYRGKQSIDARLQNGLAMTTPPSSKEKPDA